MKTITTLLIILIISIPYFTEAKQIKKHIKNTYNRYAKHFDQKGWIYSQPNYGIANKKAQTAREIISIASYYKYTDRTKINNAINQAYQEIQGRPLYTQSFEDSIAHFLITQLSNKNSKLFDDQILKSIQARHKIPEIENRSIISSVLDSYLANQLYKQKKISKKQKNNLIKKNRKKLKQGIAQSIDQDYWYLENSKKDFSVHYHALSAYMIMFYGDYFKKDKFISIAEHMTDNLRKISFKNGFIEARIGHRPIGLGAQTYLMLGVLNKRFNHKDYNVYLKYAKNRFFSDPKHPNRLEFHSTIENTSPKFHDDIGYSLIAELSQVNKKTKKTKYKKHPLYLKNKIKFHKDNRFTIQNSGGIININDKEFQLGSYGNWSKLIKKE